MKGTINGKKAREYDKQVNATTRSNKKNSFLNREIKGKKNIIVDLCCGSGISLDVLLTKAKKIYAIDASEEMISICKEKVKNEKVKFIVSDVRNVSIKDEECDYVIIRMGLHHIRDKQGVIEEAYRILKKKGKLLVIDRFRCENIIMTYLKDIIRNIHMGMNAFQHHYIKLNEFYKMINGKFKVINKFEHKIKFYTKANIVLKKI